MTDVRTFRARSMQEALEVVREEMGGDAVILHTRQVARPRFLPWRKPKEDVEITAGLGINVRPVRPSAPRPPDSPRLDLVTSDAPPAEPGIPLAPPDGPAAARPDLAPQGDAGILLPPRSPATLSGTSPARPADDSAARFAGQLDAIQKMLESLSAAGRRRGSDEIPGELFNLYTELIDAEMEDDLARELIFRLRQAATPAQLADPSAVRALLTAMVESELRCADPISVTRGRRKVVALVGPTGVGKTTTIAKLAANFRLRDGIRMGLVTVDTYRIAAVEQLRTYAEIIDLPMKVVTSPLEMRRAMDELVGLDLVLIDTAGRSPRDELQIQELKRLLVEGAVDEVHLVLSMTASLRSLQATAEKFSAAGTTSLILTKLDEAAGMGSLLSLAGKVDLPISYLTTGQDVPDDIEPARPSRVARLVLGEDRLFA